jgi:CheY-like chemotaxis protein
MISLLYVDDEPSLLEICRIFLERTGEFSVTTAESAPAALDLLAGKQFDALIADYQMPEMDGIELLEVVRKTYPELPFLLFTGKGREEIAIRAFDLGADFYIQKGGIRKHSSRTDAEGPDAIGGTGETALRQGRAQLNPWTQHHGRDVPVYAERDGYAGFDNHGGPEILAENDKERFSTSYGMHRFEERETFLGLSGSRRS